MICGGSTVTDQNQSGNFSVFTPTSAQCARLVLTPAGIAAGWKVEFMPQPRIMLDLIQLPDMRILIVNGAHTGVAGYRSDGPVSTFTSLIKAHIISFIYDRAWRELVIVEQRTLHLPLLFMTHLLQWGSDSRL